MNDLTINRGLSSEAIDLNERRPQTITSEGYAKSGTSGVLDSVLVEIGRRNAARNSGNEKERLLEERAQFLDFALERRLTEKEKNRLAYVRWLLDRIEDAEKGAELRRLEFIADQYEGLAASINGFVEQLKAARRR